MRRRMRMSRGTRGSRKRGRRKERRRMRMMLPTIAIADHDIRLADIRIA
jgi:hypothetical protein